MINFVYFCIIGLQLFLFEHCVLGASAQSTISPIENHLNSRCSGVIIRALRQAIAQGLSFQHEFNNECQNMLVNQALYKFVAQGSPHPWLIIQNNQMTLSEGWSLMAIIKALRQRNIDEPGWLRCEKSAVVFPDDLSWVHTAIVEAKQIQPNFPDLSQEIYLLQFSR